MVFGLVSILFAIINWLIEAYIAVLFVRMILDWVRVLARRWYPRGVVATLVRAVYAVTDPPLRWLRRYIKPLPMGPVYFDVSFIVLWFGLMVLRFLI
ncbi:YggT family protein [Bifidobacterium choloepi]|uniref:YggT family protein n=1 Tax=Bifidobacterium choloepi TaxID=2614131 RepID=A0A6I5NBX5_9BIFI|nr:YggT family protein [Bifidobacterium choloepi]